MKIYGRLCRVIICTIFCLTEVSASADLRTAIREYIDDKDARIGVALIAYDDTIEVNGRREFPMQSVYKFPQALLVADRCAKQGNSFCDSIKIGEKEIKENTWSPLREKYGVVDLELSLTELLTLTLAQSDNNACDILFRRFGGPAATDSLMKAYGFDTIHIYDTEEEMHANPALCYRNRATPLQLASLFRYFDNDLRNRGSEYEIIAGIIEKCDTGISRIQRSLPSGCVFGHKTGTGDINHEGRISALNDAGYIHLPDGRKIYIAVMVSDAACSYPEAEEYISDITKIIVDTCCISNPRLD